MKKGIFITRTLIFIVLSAVIFIACKKTIHGYISDQIFYQVNPFDVQQGQTVVSSSLVTNGSTQPLHVQVLGLHDANGRDVMDIFTTPQSITTFSGEVTYNDSTEESLKAKLHDSLVSPFNIAEIGGRLQFTSATSYLDPGSYNLDISVSNVRGTKILQDACQINIVPSVYYVLSSAPYSYLMDTITQVRTYSTPNIQVEREIEGPAIITFKWLDADGKTFNPKNGEVLSRPGLASFQNWDPYYDVQLTDTAFVFQYPDNVPTFPAFTTALVGTTTEVGYACYYRIPAQYLKEPGQESRTGYYMYFPNAVGSYHVTIQVTDAHKKD